MPETKDRKIPTLFLGGPFDGATRRWNSNEEVVGFHLELKRDGLGAVPSRLRKVYYRQVIFHGEKSVYSFAAPATVPKVLTGDYVLTRLVERARVKFKDG